MSPKPLKTNATRLQIWLLHATMPSCTTITITSSLHDYPICFSYSGILNLVTFHGLQESLDNRKV